MSMSKLIVKNTLAISIANFVGIFLSFVFIAAFARYLGVRNYGIFAFAFAFVALFRVAMDLGLNALIIREISKYKEKSSFYFGNSLIIEILSSAATIVIIFVLAILMGYDEETIYVVLIASFIFSIEIITWVIYSIFNAYEVRNLEALTQIIGKIIYVFVGFIGIYLHFSLIQIMLLFLVQPLIMFIVGYFLMTTKVFKPCIVIEIQKWPMLIKMSLPFAIGWLFFDLYFNIDMTMISIFIGTDDVAYYSVAYRIISAFFIIPVALSGSLMPIFSRLYIQSHEVLARSYQKIIKYLIIIGIPTTIGMTIISDITIIAIFGSQYINSIPALQILVWILAFHFITYFDGLVLGAINQQNLTIISLCIIIFINIALNLLFIPYFSYIGAAVVTVISEIALFILYSYQLKKNGITVEYHRFIFPPIIAAICMGFAVYEIKTALHAFSSFWQLIIVIPIAIILYFILLFLLKGFDEEDKNLIKSLIG
jgi:O-antigen/teichoic acid export membrane protein